MAVVVIVRELMVTAIRAEMEKAGRDFSAAFSGKLKMVLQCVAIGLVLAGRAWPEWQPGGIAIDRLAGGAAWAAVIATIWSGLEYLIAARVLVRR
jgi:CDP-diacylglycerol--glycerol-3-phosphate 3-phosphatidyltransferase